MKLNQCFAARRCSEQSLIIIFATTITCRKISGLPIAHGQSDISTPISSSIRTASWAVNVAAAENRAVWISLF